MADGITPWTMLGLLANASEREIKHAYAQRLKATRPDSDPEGFQQLHAAYLWALHACRVQTQAAANQQTQPDAEPAVFAPADSGTGLHEGRADAPAVEIPACETDAAASCVDAALPVAPFDVPAFYDAMLAVAARADADTLRQWLLAQPALWSLQHKATVAATLLPALDRHLPPVPAASFDALLEFFDLDNVHCGSNPFAVAELRRRLQLRWEFAPADVTERARRLRERHRHLYLSQDTLADLLRRLARPLPRWRLLAMAAWPETLRDHSRFLRCVLGNNPREVPDSMDRTQVPFWLAASDTGRLSLVRAGVALLRCVAIILAATTIIGLLLSQSGERTSHIAVGALLLGMIGGGIYLSMLLWLEIARWQSAPESNAHPAVWPRWLFVPLLAAAGVAFAAISTPVALTIMGLATSFAYARLSARAGGPLLGNALGRFGAIGLLYLSIGLLAVAVNYPLVGAGVACVLWTMDAWRHRYLFYRR